MILLSVVCLCLMPGFASAATRVTETQVRNICGKDLQSGGGAIGCSKKCGNTVCDYGCYKDKCNVIVFRAAPLGGTHVPMERGSLLSGSGESASPPPPPSIE
ncbi:hypothetical protein VW23_002920 [Devosia insulae DS-56]|uniref:DUF3551 domain-containing protein n=1 Tax=Devosia insulae DS-56 TaxID=1116389 RepID=A0A1E5XJQ8_9HYPH|nr:hypothetical protein [Devosia insulae]OEO28819.1 hypothetical protein VW23_002920 [Devosia insulae DS-56]